MRAMEEEHCERADSQISFITATGIETTAALEWEYVTEPVTSREYPSREDKPRRPLPASGMGARLQRINRRLAALDCPPLTAEELTATRLYDGPMFKKYQCVLRGLVPSFGGGAFHRSQFEELCQKNAYAVTITLLNTGIAKMTALMAAERTAQHPQGGVLPMSHHRPSGLARI